MVKLAELSDMVRSRRVGQRAFEADIIFKEESAYQRVVDADIFTREFVASLYRTSVSNVLAVEAFDAGKTIHIVLMRPGGRASGDPGETDVSGGLQYLPLAEVEVPS
ncbi:MAG: DUF4387 family protein [Chloroflexi bacterium]|nr:DUF4387 family protein [Chloroflexota bacterium]